MWESMRGKRGGLKKFHNFVPSLVLNLNSLMQSLGYFVGKLFQVMEGGVLCYYKDLEGSMMVVSVCSNGLLVRQKNDSVGDEYFVYLL